MNDNKKKTTVSFTTTTYSCYSPPGYVPMHNPASMHVVTKEEIEKRSQEEQKKREYLKQQLARKRKKLIIMRIILGILHILFGSPCTCC